MTSKEDACLLTGLNVSTSDLSRGSEVDTDEFTLDKRGKRLCSTRIGKLQFDYTSMQKCK